ncbi:MAG: SIMPL domain-containing protein [Anaerolineales bacterium]
MHRKYLFIPILLVLALVLSACGAVAAPAGASAPTRTLNVTGQGVVYLAPDIAYINVGIHTENPSASDAVAENNLQTQQVIETLRKNGVDPKDIQTSNFSIFLNYNYTPEGTRGEAFYVVENTVLVTVRDLSKIGALLDAAVKSGANNIYGIQFDIAEKSEAAKKAREEAFKDAQRQAQEVAQLSGVTLGNIQSISFSESFPTPIFVGGKGGGPAMAMPEVPVQPGQLSVMVTVNVSYEIK